MYFTSFKERKQGITYIFRHVLYYEHYLYAIFSLMKEFILHVYCFPV